MPPEAKHTSEERMSRSPTEPLPTCAPGRLRMTRATPAKPMATPVRRRAPKGSPSTSAASSVDTNGPSDMIRAPLVAVVRDKPPANSIWLA